MMFQEESSEKTKRFGVQLIKAAVTALALVSAAFGLYTSALGVFTAVIQRDVYLGLVLTIVYLKQLQGDYEKSAPLYRKIVDFGLLFMASGSAIYLLKNYVHIVNRIGAATTADILFGAFQVIALLEAARRLVGLPMFIIAMVFIVYGIVGPFLPYPLGHAGYDLTRIISHLYLTTEGIFGVSLGVASTVILIYSLFGSFLEVSGVGKFFTNLSLTIVGKSRGGSAKASIVASGLMGTVSGSAVANALTTGNFTLPLMMSTGYDAMTAAAILAVAATGGLIMPPVMGAGAFVMAELRGISYSSVAIAAAIPAILYYVSLFIESGLLADKNKVRILGSDEIPKVKTVIRDSYLALPLLVIIVGLIVLYLPPQVAAFWAIVCTILVSMFKRETRITAPKAYNALCSGALSMLSTAITCSTAGIIVGMVSLTGLGLKISEVLMGLSMGQSFLGLFIAMVIALVLGMGLPPVAAYIILAAMAVPPLVKMGIPLIAADMFVFYFSCIGNITPPVALAAFTTAGLAKTDPFKTGFLASFLGIVSFIVPYCFVYGPALLAQGNVIDIVIAFIGAVIGVWAMSVAVCGWYKGSVKVFWRVLLFAGAILLIKPGLITDAIGLVLVGAFLLVNKLVKPAVTASSTSA